MKAHLTKRFIDGVEIPEEGQVKVYDEKLTGFGLTVFSSGKKSFFVEYGAKGQRRRMTLGQYGRLTPDAAREMAQARLGEVVKGADPLAEREARQAMLTFSAWVEEYLRGVRLRKKQPREDERFLSPRPEPKKHGRKRGEGEEKHTAALIVDRWANRPLDRITRRDIESAMVEMASRGNTSANRWLAAVRACLSHAVLSGVIATNPAKGIKHFPEAPPRDRVLSDAEFAKVVDLFDEIEDPFERAAFVVLLDTGARKSEVLRTRWDDFDLDARLWRIPSPKSGRPQMVPLQEHTVEFLRGVERLGPWLVPGRDPARHRVDLRDTWDHIREAANIHDVTIHDLRRTFGLHVARKAGLHIASKLLRHSDIRVTERVYVPLGLDEMRTALADTQKERVRVIKFQRGEGG